MSLPRTSNEILDRIKLLGGSEPSEDDLYGAQRGALLQALPFDEAKVYLRPEAGHTHEGWEVERRKEPEAVVDEVTNFFGEAWRMVNKVSRSSSQRALDHLTGLVWLLNRHPDLVEYLDDPENFRFYGKPGLVRICEAFDFNWRALDDDQWRESIEEDAEILSASQALALLSSEE